MSVAQPTTLWNKNFALYWSGVLQAQLGGAISGVAFSYLVLELTQSVAASSLTLALTMLPGILAPLAATWVDRLPLRVPLVAGDVLRGLLSLLVWHWASQGELTPMLLYLTSLLNGLIGIFYSPAAQAALPELVPEKDLVRANGLMGIANQSAGILGLVAGGVLVARFGLLNTLLIDAFTFLVMAVLLLQIRFPARVRPEQENTYWQDLKAGFAVFTLSPLLRAFPLLGFVVMAAFAPLNAALPKHLTNQGIGSEGYGFMMALLSGGMLVGDVLVSVLGQKFNPRKALGICYTVNGGLFLLFGVAQGWWAVALLMFLIGAASGITMVSNSILLQTQVPRHQLGRAFGVLGATGQLGMPLALLLISTFVDRLPLGWLFLGTGVLLVMVAVLWQMVCRLSEPARTAGVQA